MPSPSFPGRRLNLVRQVSISAPLSHIADRPPDVPAASDVHQTIRSSIEEPCLAAPVNTTGSRRPPQALACSSPGTSAARDTAPAYACRRCGRSPGALGCRRDLGIVLTAARLRGMCRPFRLVTDVARFLEVLTEPGGFVRLRGLGRGGPVGRPP